MPFLAPSGELKTKPTQHSVAALRNIGIQPDALVLRADREIPDGHEAQDLADVRRRPRRRRRRARRAVDLRHPPGAAPRGPRRLRRAPARAAVPRRRLDGVGRPARPRPRPRRDGDDRAGRQVRRPARRLPVGDRGAARGRVRAPGARWRSAGSSPTTARPRPARRRRSTGWTACSSPAGSACAASRARSARSGTPAPAASRRSGCAWACSAWSSRRRATSPGSTAPTPPSSTPHAPHPVISTMAEQVDVVAGERDMGGTMRLGRLPGRCSPRARSSRRPTARARSPSGTGTATRSTTPTATGWPTAGLVISGTLPDGSLVEFVELPAEVHPFFVGTQAHPELKSRPTRPHPLFAAFVRAAIDYRAADRLPVELHRERATVGSGTGAREHSSVAPAVSAPRHDFAVVSSRRHLHGQGAGGAPRPGRACPAGGTSVREIMEHAGAVAVAALDADDRLMMIYQYRHALERRLWEMPAGCWTSRGRTRGGDGAARAGRGGRPRGRRVVGADRRRAVAGVLRRDRAGLPGDAACTTSAAPTSARTTRRRTSRRTGSRWPTPSPWCSRARSSTRAASRPCWRCTRCGPVRRGPAPGRRAVAGPARRGSPPGRPDAPDRASRRDPGEPGRQGRSGRPCRSVGRPARMTMPSMNAQIIADAEEQREQQLGDADPGVAGVEPADAERQEQLQQPGDDLRPVRVREPADRVAAVGRLRVVAAVRDRMARGRGVGPG